MFSIHASWPSWPQFESLLPKLFSEEKIIDVAEFNQRRWLEESGRQLENVDRPHLVLASGKPVPQKMCFFHFSFFQGKILYSIKNVTINFSNFP